MRTPILQKIILDKEISISKTLLIDECTSVGASLLRSFDYKYFPIEHLKELNHYKDEKIIIINYEKNKKLEKNIIDYIKKQRKKDAEYDIFIHTKSNE